MIWFFLYGINAFYKLPIDRFINNNIVLTALTVYMSITFFIVLFVLDPVHKGIWDPFQSSSEIVLHNLTPIMSWIFYFQVKGEGAYNVKQVLMILIYPLIYFAITLIIGTNISYLDGTPAYAYNFVNPNNYASIFSFAGFIGMLIAVFAIFGILLMKLKQHINRVYFDEEHVD